MRLSHLLSEHSRYFSSDVTAVVVVAVADVNLLALSTSTSDPDSARVIRPTLPELNLQMNLCLSEMDRHFLRSIVDRNSFG